MEEADTQMVTLRPMTDDEYDAYKATALEDYAAERAQAEDTSLAEERKAASASGAS